MKVIWLIDKPDSVDNRHDSIFNVWNHETVELGGRARYRVKTRHFWSEKYDALITSVICYDEDYDNIMANLPAGVAPFLSYDQGKGDADLALSIADFNNIRNIPALKVSSISKTDSVETIITKTIRTLEGTVGFTLADDVK